MSPEFRRDGSVDDLCVVIPLPKHELVAGVGHLDEPTRPHLEVQADLNALLNGNPAYFGWPGCDSQLLHFLS